MAADMPDLRGHFASYNSFYRLPFEVTSRNALFIHTVQQKRFRRELFSWKLVCVSHCFILVA